MADRHTLATSVILDGKYRIDRVLGAGGFGITYEAEHVALGRRVAIKEYFPAEFAVRAENGEVRPARDADRAQFEHMRQGFLKEARAISLLDHPAITRVLGVFEALGTVYLVMRFEDGQSVKSWWRGLGRLPTDDEILRIAIPLLEALEFIHEKGFLHRDVAPDNILLSEDLQPVLIDFGAARPIMAARTGHFTGFVKFGYSPPEQYTTDSRTQGPWTDIYALAGTLYYCVTGKAPPDASQRMLGDSFAGTSEATTGSYSPALLAAIDRGLAVRPEERPQTIAAWRPMFAAARGAVPADIDAGSGDAELPDRAVVRDDGLPPDLSEVGKRPASWWPAAGVAMLVFGCAAAAVAIYSPTRDTAPVAPPQSAPIAKSDPAPAPTPPAVPAPAPASTLLIDLARASFRDCETCPEMSVVPAGRFTMGSPAAEAGRQANEGPQREIAIPRPLAIARHETTRGAWRAFSDATSRKIDGDCRALQFLPELIADYEAGRARADWGANGQYSWANTNYPQDDTHPVACISYADAEDYLTWLSARTGARYRLPSEAEWEYGARGGTTTPFSFGATATPRDASYHHPSLYPGGETGTWRRGTVPVGSFAANRFGLFDMHGNVWEWVADCGGASLADLDETAAPYSVAACESAGMRGGAFWTVPGWIRSAYRYSYGRTLRGAAAGFRAARELREDEIRALRPLLQARTPPSRANDLQ